MVAGVESIIHNATPTIVKMMPATGASGIIGQMIISIKLKMQLTTIMRVPVIRRTRREKKPIMRETSRSINIWNLRSREAPAEAVSAEIWRKGLNKVRMRDPMEKKSVMLAREVFSF